MLRLKDQLPAIDRPVRLRVLSAVGQLPEVGEMLLSLKRQALFLTRLLLKAWQNRSRENQHSQHCNRVLHTSGNIQTALAARNHNGHTQSSEINADLGPRAMKILCVLSAVCVYLFVVLVELVRVELTTSAVRL